MSIESNEVEVPPRMALSADDEIASVAKGIRRVNFMLRRERVTFSALSLEVNRVCVIKIVRIQDRVDRSSGYKFPGGLSHLYLEYLIIQ